MTKTAAEELKESTGNVSEVRIDEASPTVKKIYDTITKRNFADWYGDGGRFDDYIQDPRGDVSKEDIFKDIAKMFNV